MPNDATVNNTLGLSPEELHSLQALLGYREQAEIEAANLLELAEAGMAAPLDSDPTADAIAAADKVSEKAFKLIVDYETGGKAYYEQIIKSRPIWPEASSGITIGFGYDLGYVSKDEYRRDWADLISGLTASQAAAMEACVGFHSGKDSTAKMKQLLATVQDVIVSFAAGEVVFKAKTLPKFSLITHNALPNCDLLSGDSFGALVSLTFNRGASYSKAHDPAKDPKDRYREMRAIKADMIAKNFADIPKQITDMIRVWVGTSIEKGMRRRRTDEAALFLGGLPASTPLAVAGPLSEAELVTSLPASTEVDATRSAISLNADSTDGPSDEDFWTETTEDDLIAAALEGFSFARSNSDVKWASDADHPDYAHLGSGLPIGGTFQLKAEDLALLAQVNSFNVAALGDDTPVLFGLRGAGILKGHTDPEGVMLIDQRPDHKTPRCVIGVWDRKAGKVSVFPGSTIPNESAVETYFSNQSAGNLLATGLYQYACGAHTTTNRSTPGCFLLRKTDMSKRVVLVWRSTNDLCYKRDDIPHRCAPGDNIHPAFFSQPTGFSSLGCQTIVGTFKDGSHKGPWADFRKAAGFTTNEGVPKKPFLYMLLTGAEARMASALRISGTAGDSIALRKLRRLRFGSSGPGVTTLQTRLNISGPDGDFGPTTAETLHNFQRSLPQAAKKSDGILTPDMDQEQGWNVFGSIGV